MDVNLRNYPGQRSTQPPRYYYDCANRGAEEKGRIRKSVSYNEPNYTAE